jgi:hypothetical protein
MTHAAWLLALLLLASPSASAADNKTRTRTRRNPTAAAKTAVSADDLVKQAEEKAARGRHRGGEGAVRESGRDAHRLRRRRPQGRPVPAVDHDLDAAMDAYKKAGDTLTGAAKGEALGRLAIVQETRGVPEFAATAEAAAAADKEGPFPNIALARLRAREGKGDEALALAQKAVAAGGADAQAAVGRAQEARNALPEAEAAYRAAGGAEGTNLTATVGLARVLRRTGRSAEALPLLEKVIAAAPGAVDAYKESARAKIAAGRGADALGDASTAAALAENDPDAARAVQEATVAKALSYVAQNQAALAIQDLTALRDKSPTSPSRASASARLRGQPAGGPRHRELQKAVELDPASAEAQYQLGYTQHMLKRDAAAAVGPYREAVAAEPGNVDYRTQLGAALAAANQPDRARGRAHEGHELARIPEGRRLDLPRPGPARGEEVQGRPRLPRQGGGGGAQQRPDRDLHGLVVLRPQGLEELHRPRAQGEGAGTEGADAARLPDAHRRGGAHQVKRGAVAGSRPRDATACGMASPRRRPRPPASGRR